MGDSDARIESAPRVPHQARQAFPGADRDLPTSEITAPSPFPEGTPDTLVTAPAPSATLVLPAQLATGGTATAPSLSALRSMPTLSSTEQGGRSTGTSLATAPTGTSGFGGPDGGGGGGIDSPASGLSTAAAAGIGVGSTVGGVLLLVLVGWFVQRRKRLAPTAGRAYDRPLKGDPAGEVAEAGGGGGGGIEMSSHNSNSNNGRGGGGGGSGALTSGGGGGAMAVRAEDRA